MSHLIGRVVHVPRAVFANDIKRGLSQEPPNGSYWVAEVLEFDSSGTSVPFKLQLAVHDEQGKLVSEEQDISRLHLEKWIVLLDTERNGKDVCTSPKLEGDGFIIGKSQERKRSGHEVFATPQFGERYTVLHCV
jgi:hypothetical protein